MVQLRCLESHFAELCTPQRYIKACHMGVSYHFCNEGQSPQHTMFPLWKQNKGGQGEFSFRFKLTYLLNPTTAVAQWLRCCATNRKVDGSIPDGVIGIFH